MANKKYIYVVRAENTNYYKIGVSINPKKRLSGIQTGNHLKVNLIFCRVETPTITEDLVHSKLHKFNTFGEWFFLDDEGMCELIKAIKPSPKDFKKFCCLRAHERRRDLIAEGDVVFFTMLAGSKLLKGTVIEIRRVINMCGGGIAKIKCSGNGYSGRTLYLDEIWLTPTKAILNPVL